jgi:hypothetical protein
MSMGWMRLDMLVQMTCTIYKKVNSLSEHCKSNTIGHTGMETMTRHVVQPQIIGGSNGDKRQ